MAKIYYGDGQGAFAGMARLLEAAKKIDPTVTRKDVADFLAAQDLYQLYFEARPSMEPGRSHHCAAPGSLIALDTMYAASLSSAFKYILVPPGVRA